MYIGITLSVIKRYQILQPFSRAILHEKTMLYLCIKAKSVNKYAELLTYITKSYIVLLLRVLRGSVCGAFLAPVGK